MRKQAPLLLMSGLSFLPLGCGSDSESGSGAGGSAAHGGTAGGVGGQSGSGGQAGSTGSGGIGGSVGSGGSAGSGGSGGSSGSAGSGGTGGSAGTPTNLWSMGYYASWQESQYSISDIEWSGLTHVAVAFYMPDAAGNLALLGGRSALGDDMVAAAHAHGVKAIASIGGGDSGSAFRQATASGAMDAFITNLVTLLNATGYDGIDIDWEPLDVVDQPVAVEIANRVRAAHPGALMTIPIGSININIPGDLSGYAAINGAYDQLNIMSYGMAGPWQGWKSWHSSPLYQQDSATPESIDSSVQAYLAAGVSPSKLGVGIGFFGLCYTPPVTGPDQPLGGSTIAASDGTMSYAHIMQSYYSASARNWDLLARATFLTFSTAQGPEGCTYISYDDEQSIAEKAAYLKSEGLGGVIQWEINEGFIPQAAPGATNPLLTAIRDNILR